MLSQTRRSVTIASSRFVAMTTRSEQHPRLLSTQATVAIDKLRIVFEEYRLQNYQQELPTRFKKDIIQEACRSTGESNSTNCIVQEGIQRVLVNIGASQHVSSHEIKSIFDELGNDNGEIYSQKLMQLL